MSAAKLFVNSFSPIMLLIIGAVVVVTAYFFFGV